MKTDNIQRKFWAMVDKIKTLPQSTDKSKITFLYQNHAVDVDGEIKSMRVKLQELVDYKKSVTRSYWKSISELKGE